MCIGVPGQVREASGSSSLGMATVDVSGSLRSVCTAYVPEVSVNDWVLISHGFIMDVISESDAQEILRTIEDHRIINPELLPQGKERLADVSRRPRTN